MADLSFTNCNLQNGAAIGGNGGGGGMDAGGGIYIDRGKTLILTNSQINSCKAQGGIAIKKEEGGAASFSTAAKNGSQERGRGDYPGIEIQGGISDGSSFLIGDGGGRGAVEGGFGEGNGRGRNGSHAIGANGGYCPRRRFWCRRRLLGERW